MRLGNVPPNTLVRLPDGTIWLKTGGVSVGADGRRSQLVPAEPPRWELSDTEVEIVEEDQEGQS